MQNRKSNYKYYLIFLIIILTIFYGVLLKKYFLWGSDLSYQAFPLQKYFFEVLKKGQFTFWNPYIFLGHPFIADPGSGIFYPFNLFYLLFSSEYAIFLIIILNFFMIAITTFLLLQELSFSPFTCFFITCSYVFSNLFFHIFGNPITLNALTFVPLSFLLTIKIIKTNHFFLYLILALILATQFLSGEVEILFYTFLGIAILWFFYLPKTKRILKNTFSFCLLLLCFAGICVVQFLPSFELSTSSLRSGSTKLKEKFLKKEIPKPHYLLLLPTLYFDRNTPFIISVKNPAYSDLFLFLLLPLIFLFNKIKKIKSFFYLFFISLFITFFNPFVFLIYQKIPILKMLRMPIKSTLTITYICLIILAAYILNEVIKKNLLLMKMLNKIFFFILFFFLIEIILSFKGLNYDNPLEGILNEGLPFLFLITLFYFIIIYYLQNKISFKFFNLFLLTLIFLSLIINPLWRLNNCPIDNNNSTLCKINYKQSLKTPKVVYLIGKDSKNYRIWDFPNTYTGHGNLSNRGINYKLFTVGGFSTVLSLRWVKFSEKLLNSKNEITQQNILSLINVKYEIYSFPP